MFSLSLSLSLSLSALFEEGARDLGMTWQVRTNVEAVVWPRARAHAHLSIYQILNMACIFGINKCGLPEVVSSVPQHIISFIVPPVIGGPHTQNTIMLHAPHATYISCLALHLSLNPSHIVILHVAR